MLNTETAPRSAGYRRLHGFLCVIAALILLCCINTTFCMRRYIQTNQPAAAMSTSQLSDTKIPFTGKTVAALIKADYVTDEKVTGEDVSAAVDEMGIPSFIAEKLDRYGSLLRGDTDEVVSITADEIVGLLEDSEDALYDKCLLVIEDSDKEELRTSAEKPLSTFNKIMSAVYGSKFGRGLARFRMSRWHYVLDVVLLILLLLRWMNIHEVSGSKKTNALRGMGKTLLIPMAITLILLAVFGIASLFVKDGIVGMYAFTKALRAPMWILCIFEIALGCFLISLAGYQEARAEYKETAASLPVRNRTGRAKMDTVNVPHSPAPARSTLEKRFCIYCGREIAKDAGFCSYCGKNLNAAPSKPVPQAAPAETAVPEVPEVPDVPEVPEVPSVPTIPSVPETPETTDPVISDENSLF